MIDVQPTVGDAIGSTVPSSELVQTYFVEQDLPNVVFAAARPVQAQPPARAAQAQPPQEQA